MTAGRWCCGPRQASEARHGYSGRWGLKSRVQHCCGFFRRRRICPLRLPSRCYLRQWDQNRAREGVECFRSLRRGGTVNCLKLRCTGRRGCRFFERNPNGGAKRSDLSVEVHKTSSRGRWEKGRARGKTWHSIQDSSPRQAKKKQVLAEPSARAHSTGGQDTLCLAGSTAGTTRDASLPHL